MRGVRLGLLFVLPALLWTAGCSQKLTYERWESVYEGQRADVVEQVLGEPVERLDMRWLYMDADRGITADIYFQDGEVIGKTWSDPERGMVGKSPHVNQPGDSDTLKYRKVE